MPWIKLDEAFADHPKFLAAGPLAGYLAITAIAWSRRNGTNGHIPSAQVERLVNLRGFAHHMWMGEVAGGGDDADALVLAEELVEVGLWERCKRKAGGYVIHDFLDWQDSAEKVQAEREKARERMRSRRVRPNSNGTSREVQPTFAGSSATESREGE